MSGLDADRRYSDSLKVLVTDHWTDQSETFEGTHDQVEKQLFHKYPWLQVEGAWPNVMDTLEHLDSTGGFQVEMEGDEVQIAPSSMWDSKEAVDHPVVDAMLGFHPTFTTAFQAAQFLSGGEELPYNLARQALWEHEDDLEAAALVAYGLPLTNDNRASLRAVEGMATVKKAEPATPTARVVRSPLPSGEDVAEDVRRAYADQFVFPVKLGGKHSKGSMLARDEEKKETWLLKPGFGGVGPIKGAKEDPSTQSAREAAFYQVAKDWGIDRWFPRGELLVIDDREYAALQLLGWDYKPLSKIKEGEPAAARRLLHSLLQDGTLHQWAVIDFVLANGDRHGQNMMVNPDGDVRLIDHGSAFAGEAFDPAHDRCSFIPYYLRAWAPDKFNSLSVEEKFRYLPRVNEKVAADLRGWLLGLSHERLQVILHGYGIDTAPTLERLVRVCDMSVSSGVDEAVNRLWVTV